MPWLRELEEVTAARMPMKMINPEELFLHFAQRLFQEMKQINPAVDDLEYYEFEYALDSLVPSTGWESITLDPPEVIEKRICQKDFYESIKTKPMQGSKIVLDDQIVNLTQQLFSGLVTGFYSKPWVNTHFHFDVRGFFFLPRTTYFTKAVVDHFGGKPTLSFEKKQMGLKAALEVGYKDYRKANQEVDDAFIAVIEKVIRKKGTPILLTIAGPTAAGKTEIVSRLSLAFTQMGYPVSSIEMDNFAKDKEYRDAKQHGKESIHFELFMQAMDDLSQGRVATIPQYDFYALTSSHDLDSHLKPGRSAKEIQPADVIFLEGNFPFHMEELKAYLGIKIVYLADDDIRLKRKWKRDIDLRKKYDPRYFQNRYFQTQFLRAQEIYLPLMQACEIVVDTSGANLWLADSLVKMLKDEI
jgi:uridine kinase